jgi:hypothetical protein
LVFLFYFIDQAAKKSPKMYQPSVASKPAMPQTSTATSLPGRGRKTDEIDVLTEMLVKSMNETSDQELEAGKS